MIFFAPNWQKYSSNKLATTESKGLSHQPLVVQKLTELSSGQITFHWISTMKIYWVIQWTISIRSLSSHHDDGDKNSQICILDATKRVFSVFYILQPFSFFPAHEITCFTVVSVGGGGLSALYDFFSLFFFWTSIRSFYFKSMVVNSLFAGQTNWNNREIILESRSHIFR